MDRRLLFPVVAITAWAQQPSPGGAEAEQALRERATQFYQFQVDKNFRKAEALVAEVSKDAYYNGSKPDIKEFSVQKIELLDNNTRARVTLKQKQAVRSLVGVLDFELPVITSWRVEGGQWFWYIDPETSTRSPFGKMDTTGSSKGAIDPPARGVDLATLMTQVTVDRTSVTLTTASPVQTVTVTNNLEGPLRLEMSGNHLEGISVEIEKPQLQSGEKSAVRFRAATGTKSSGVLSIVASPLNKVFDIQVHAN
jgi:hypothetical protein